MSLSKLEGGKRRREEGRKLKRTMSSCLMTLGLLPRPRIELTSPCLDQGYPFSFLPCASREEPGCGVLFFGKHTNRLLAQGKSALRRLLSSPFFAVISLTPSFFLFFQLYAPVPSGAASRPNSGLAMQMSEFGSNDSPRGSYAATGQGSPSFNKEGGFEVSQVSSSYILSRQAL